MLEHKKPSIKVRLFGLLSQIYYSGKKLDKLKFVYVCLCITLVGAASPIAWSIKNSSNPISKYVQRIKGFGSIMGDDSDINHDGSLAERDKSGSLKPKEGEKEVIEKRVENFKTFQKGNSNEFRVAGTTGPIHFKEDPFDQSEPYKDINISIEEHKKTGVKIGIMR